MKQTKKILIGVIILLFIACILSWVIKKPEKKKRSTEITPSTKTEKRAETKEVQTLVSEQEIKIPEERRDPFVKPPYLTKLEKENEALKSQVAKLQKAEKARKAVKITPKAEAKKAQKTEIIQNSTMKTTEIQAIIKQKRMEEEISGLRQRLSSLESQQYQYEEYEEPEEEYAEQGWYEPQTVVYYLYPRWISCSFYPFGWWRFMYWYSYYYYPFYSYYYPVYYYHYYPTYYQRYSRYFPSTYQAEFYRIHKNQLKRKTSTRTSLSRQGLRSSVRTHPSRISAKKVEKIPGKYRTYWGDSRKFGKSSSKVSPSRIRSTPRSSARIYSNKSRTSIRRSVSSRSKSVRSSRSIRSTRSSRTVKRKK